MNRKEITNSQDYKATKAALEWWYSLPEEQRKATDINAEPDIVDAYSDGVIYGWNNPNWISVEEELPKVGASVLFVHPDESETMKGYITRIKTWWSEKHRCSFEKVTHWMPLPQLPRKEDKE